MPALIGAAAGRDGQLWSAVRGYDRLARMKLGYRGSAVRLVGMAA